MTDFSLVSFVTHKDLLSRWNPRYLAYMGLLPVRLGDMFERENRHKKSLKVHYLKEVSRT